MSEETKQNFARMWWMPPLLSLVFPTGVFYLFCGGTDGLFWLWLFCAVVGYLPFFSPGYFTREVDEDLMP